MDWHQSCFTILINAGRINSINEERPILVIKVVAKMADQLAERLGIASDTPERLRAA